jgi:large subunit ribosomal protein L24
VVTGVRARPRLRRDDQVVVIAGKERGKTGRVLRIDIKRQQVVLEGLNLVKKAIRPTQQRQQGGISEIEAPIHLSNVMLSTPEGRSRIRCEAGGAGTRRVAVRTGQEL